MDYSSYELEDDPYDINHSSLGYDEDDDIPDYDVMEDTEDY